MLSLSLSLSLSLFSLRGVVDNVLDCDIIVSHFKFQSGYYFHFRTNILVKDMNPFMSSS